MSRRGTHGRLKRHRHNVDRAQDGTHPDGRAMRRETCSCGAVRYLIAPDPRPMHFQPAGPVLGRWRSREEWKRVGTGPATAVLEHMEAVRKSSGNKSETVNA